MEFRIATHTVTGKPMVEVWREGEFIAGIYDHEDGMRVISKYPDGVQHEVTTPPSMVIRFSIGELTAVVAEERVERGGNLLYNAPSKPCNQNPGAFWRW